MKDLDAVSNDVNKASKLKQLKTSGQTLTYQGVHVDPAEISCRNGSVFGMNHKTGNNEKCRKYTICYYGQVHKTCRMRLRAKYPNSGR